MSQNPFESLGGAGGGLDMNALLQQAQQMQEQLQQAQERLAEAEVEGTRPQALYERATACLDERRDALAGLLDVFADSAAADVPRLVPAVAALEPATACADTTLLLRRPELPARPAARLRAHALRRPLLRGPHSPTHSCAGPCRPTPMGQPTTRSPTIRSSPPTRATSRRRVSREPPS